jgi:hypothetical protein
MTFSSSCAPLTGISRARLPAWALPEGWPTQANGTDPKPDPVISPANSRA